MPAIVIARPEAGEPLRSPIDISGAIITGAWSMVTDREDWSERVAEWIRNVFKVGTPVFGVCYGHQPMAHILGGRVDDLGDGAALATLPVALNASGVEDAALYVGAGRNIARTSLDVAFRRVAGLRASHTPATCTALRPACLAA